MNPLAAGVAAVAGGVGFAYLTSMDEEDEEALASVAMDYLSAAGPRKPETSKGASATSMSQDQQPEPEEYGYSNPDDVLGYDESNESWEPAPTSAAPKPQAAAKAPEPAGEAKPSSTGSRIVVKDTGGWSYEILGGGKIKILTAPPNSSMAGKTLDPAKIASLPPGAQKDRLQLAYNSIKSVANGGPPLVAIRGGPAKPKPAAEPEPAAPPPAAEPPAPAVTQGAREPNPMTRDAQVKEKNPKLRNMGRLLERLDSPNYFDETK